MMCKNILVACSELDFILISKVLRTNCSLELARNNEDILLKTGDSKYDLFIIDVSYVKGEKNMLLALTKYCVPTIVITSEPYDARDKQLKKNGCSACYVKPIKCDEFYELVHSWLK